jgi:hypothetical protein
MGEAWASSQTNRALADNYKTTRIMYPIQPSTKMPWAQPHVLPVEPVLRVYQVPYCTPYWRSWRSRSVRANNAIGGRKQKKRWFFHGGKHNKAPSGFGVLFLQKAVLITRVHCSKRSGGGSSATPSTRGTTESPPRGPRPGPSLVPECSVAQRGDRLALATGPRARNGTIWSAKPPGSVIVFSGPSRRSSLISPWPSPGSITSHLLYCDHSRKLATLPLYQVDGGHTHTATALPCFWFPCSPGARPTLPYPLPTQNSPKRNSRHQGSEAGKSTSTMHPYCRLNQLNQVPKFDPQQTPTRNPYISAPLYFGRPEPHSNPRAYQKPERSQSTFSLPLLPMLITDPERGMTMLSKSIHNKHEGTTTLRRSSTQVHVNPDSAITEVTHAP